MDLKKIRKKIDQIDNDLIKLLDERMELALRTRKFKKAIQDKDRENRVIERLNEYSLSSNLAGFAFLEGIFKKIMEESRKIQEKERKLIGFQGEHGAFGEVAARFYDKSMVTIPCQQFAHVIEGVEKEYLDFGIVPVENSLGGAVTQVNELLIKTNLKVIGAVNLRINHCLLAPPDANYQEIRVVYSHPQALSQCRGFIDRHQLEAHTYYDTAGAARMLAQENLHMSAVIASKLCADLYGLEVIKENIEDHKTNYTRFLILSRNNSIGPAKKCSIIFSTAHEAGTLFSVLRIFADAGINLTRIESMPERDDPGNSIFFLDFQSGDSLEDVDKILKTVKKETKMFKYLGCYEEKVCQ